ncbi:MAG: DUF3592 domain-containing protein [Saprospiraceae bacterium]|nr:DUF3592 domain-containing protein [Lewinella sp.]
MDLKEKISLIVCMILCICGTIFAIIAIREYRSSGVIVRTGIQTKGVVVEMERRPRKVGENTTPNSFAPVVLFLNETGTQHKYYSQLYTAIPTYEIGQKVDIWYLPDEPQKATLNGGDAWVLPLVFGLFGGIMCLIGYPWLFSIIRQKMFS